MASLERATVVSYRLPIVTVALSVTISVIGRNLRSNVSDAQINRGWVTLGQNLGVFPLEQTRHVGVANSERPRLTNGEIIFENSNLCDHNSPTSQTGGQTDRHAILLQCFYRALH